MKQQLLERVTQAAIKELAMTLPDYLRDVSPSVLRQQLSVDSLKDVLITKTQKLSGQLPELELIPVELTKQLPANLKRLTDLL